MSAEAVAKLLRPNGIRPLTLPRRNQKRQLLKAVERLINPARQIIETVNGQLAEQFNIDSTEKRSPTSWGNAGQKSTIPGGRR